MTVQHPKPKSTPQRQIILPYSVALRIAYENIRMRLTRSLLAMGGIVLGVAFLNSVMVANLTTRGMREWAAGAATSPHFATLQQQRHDLEQQLQTKDRALNDWNTISGELATVRNQLSAPARLEAIMTKNG